MLSNRAIGWSLVAVGGIVFLGVLDRACRDDAMLRQAKADYAELKRIAEADHAMSLNRIGELNGEIGHRDETIVNLEKVITQNRATMGKLSGQLADLQAAEPPAPELEAHPLVVNLRAQIEKLSEMLTLSQNTVALQLSEIGELRGKFNASLAIGEEWRAGYERERILRVQAEGLFKIAEHRLKMNRFWGKVKNAALVGAAGYIAYRLVK